MNNIICILRGIAVQERKYCKPITMW